MGRSVKSSYKSRHDLLYLDTLCQKHRLKIAHVSPAQAKMYAEIGTKFFLKSGKVECGWYWWKVRSNGKPNTPSAIGPFKYKIDAYRNALHANSISPYDPKHDAFRATVAAQAKMDAASVQPPITIKRERLTPAPDIPAEDLDIQINVPVLKRITPREQTYVIIETDTLNEHIKDD